MLASFGINPTRCATGLHSCALLVIVLSVGCRSMKPQGAVTESVMTCRTLSAQASQEIEQGRWRQAETLLTQAIDACPTNAEARRRYAEVLEQQGELEKAIDQVTKSLETEINVQTLVKAGELLLASGQNDLALWRAEQALSEDATYAPAWALRGRVMARLGDTDQALADMHRSLDYDPKENQVQLAVAELYQQRGQPRRVIVTMQHLFENCPAEQAPPRAWLLQGLAYKSLGRYQDAANSLAVACRGSQDSEALFHLGHAQALSGQRMAAESSLSRSLALDRGNQSSLALLRQLQSEMASRTTSGNVQSR